MFHVSQWSLSIVTIAFVLLSSFQTIWKCQVRLAAQEAEGGGGGRGWGRGIGATVGYSLFAGALISVMMT